MGEGERSWGLTCTSETRSAKYSETLIMPLALRVRIVIAADLEILLRKEARLGLVCSSSSASTAAFAHEGSHVRLVRRSNAASEMRGARSKERRAGSKRDWPVISF